VSAHTSAGGTAAGGRPHDDSDDAVVRPPDARPAASPGPLRAIGMPAEKSKDFGGSTKRLLARMRVERVRAIAVLCFALVSVTLTVMGPKLLGHGTDLIFDAIRQGNRIDFPALRGVLMTVLGIYVCAAGLSYLQSYTLAGVVQRTVYRLRSDVEDKLSRLPLSYVDAQARGDLLSRVTNDIDNISQSLQQTLSQLLTSVLSLIGVLTLMFVISPVLATIAAITIPASLGIIRLVTSRSKKRFVAQWRHTGALNAQIEEAFTGHALVKVFGQQLVVEERFRTKNEELYTASFGAQFISGIIQPAMMFLGNLNYVAIAVIGGLRVSSGTMTLGDVQAFIQYSRQFTQPMTQLASMANVLQSGVASAERVFELLDAQEQSEDLPATAIETDPGVPSAGSTPGQIGGRVEFEHVAFSYDPKNPLITDLSFVAEPGQTIAIVGPTGAGKTTLVNLIMRFYELDAGRITLDGIDIADMTRHDLRANVGMVLQDTWLFSGTIRDNIAYGNLDSTETHFQEAVRATYVDRFVHSLPDGYDTLIDDEGGTVSAGEKQLLTIARAFLADPAILILDEATSSVDTRTEVLIQKAMAALRSQRTSFVIAHRLSTIRDADLILVMNSGNIVEQGTHDELLHQQGAYFDLYNAQFAAPATQVD
jgi:ATP-binding cassette, subfamily B, multidrug efflux pump